MPSRIRTLSLVFLFCLVAAACGGILDPSQRRTETFSGLIPTVAHGGGAPIQTFPVSKRGELDIKLTSLVPTFANQVLVTVGQQVSGSCATLSQFGLLVGGDAPLGLVDPGAYCLALSDPGTMTTDETYTVDVIHS
jgi:hypothetical protein